ncbi:MAG: lysyl-tRNA synthetase class 2 [Myxococcota bacterium]|jgi:lysyl-tRNA synthetase class 2
MKLSGLDKIMAERRAKADRIRSDGGNPYANDFDPTHTLAGARAEFGESAPGMSETEGHPAIRLAGRVMGKNRKGKMMFLRLRDRSSTEADPQFQVVVTRDSMGGPEAYQAFHQTVDVGDIVGVEGPVFRTNRGELSVLGSSGRVLTKTARPLPDKFHGLTDKETRLRQRYVDLIMNMEVREVFRIRTRVMRFTRDFFESRDFMEVETPMMQVVAGGATARPFKTHHNALNIPLFLRVAPELYLKRLVVGGFERVYELNRNFRNEGVSQKHNPEFTMLEFYQAYADYKDLIATTEAYFQGLCQAVHGEGVTTLQYGEHTLEFGKPFAQYTVREALVQIGEVDEAQTTTLEGLHAVATERGVSFDPAQPYGKMLVYLFEELCEAKLIQPTFITRYPLAVSPLSRKADDDPEWVDRFELFIGGNEIANGFSELNDPEDQRSRFEDQMAQRAAGDDEAMPIDEDYIRALEYGMPPTAGEGIGMDRVVMLMANRQSIREIIFFPHMRPEV